jgi:hypothetical protein
VRRHLLLARWRHFLLSFLLCSSAVYMRAMLRHFSMCRISLLLLTLVACMLSGNLWIDFLAHPSFWWNHRVTCLTKTVLRRWGVATSFALLSLEPPSIFIAWR